MTQFLNDYMYSLVNHELLFTKKTLENCTFSRMDVECGTLGTT